MSDFRDQCAYLADGQSKGSRCVTPATYRFPLRCVDHGGHFDFTERWVEGRWCRWPAHALDFVNGLEDIK